MIGNKYVIALAGNANVGKSTVFNELTGLDMHTGNWAGKTVDTAEGSYTYNGKDYILVDIPGTYSLYTGSADEETAMNFICSGKPDAIIAVCDATCLERNLNLVMQLAEVNPKTIVCVNLLDEAEKKKIEINFEKLSEELGLPVVGTSARSGKGLEKLMEETEKAVFSETPDTYVIDYGSRIESILEKYGDSKLERWELLRVLNGDESFVEKIGADEELNQQENADIISERLVKRAEEIAEKCVTFGNAECFERDIKTDRIVTGRFSAFPIMLLLLGVVFWITIEGANYPSALLSDLFFGFGDILKNWFVRAGIPNRITSFFCDGVYCVLAWVVAVMLPPMAIFFPMFTLLEDSGYLPRVAFNLDGGFRKAGACGKQCLTMCMGFGCNAVGVTGCRIISSARERLIAIITNSFSPCNGRFPTMITIITIFFVWQQSGIISALILLLFIVISVFATLGVSKFLSLTLLKGQPSSFILELPPYRKPQILKTIVRSVKDRTIFVLGRACISAIPAGALIWVMANVTVGGTSLLNYTADFLNPLGEFIGLDGVILLAFILGFPANEIVMPVIIMAYMSTGTLMEFENLAELRELLIANGWDCVKGVCMILFSMMHFPCATTCMTIKKETGSIKWTAIAFLVPLVCGICVCSTFSAVARLFLP